MLYHLPGEQEARGLCCTGLFLVNKKSSAFKKALPSTNRLHYPLTGIVPGRKNFVFLLMPASDYIT